MRRWLAIARATALEILSDPLSLLLLVAALTLTALAPAFHYHQFGEATRMARDAGLSALFTCGLLVAVFGTIRSFRREIETGTLQMALAHPVSRTVFFLAKVVGITGACAVFSAIVFLTALTIVNGAAIGGEIAAKSGDIAKIWGPSLALGLGTILLPLVIAAALNRFAQFRFVLTFFAFAVVLALAGAAYRLDLGLAGRLASVVALVFVFILAFLSLSAAAAVRFRANGAAAAAGLLFVLALPVIGNYYLPDALANGGSVSPVDFVFAVLAAVPAIAAFLLAGIGLINGKDVA